MAATVRVYYLCFASAEVPCFYNRDTRRGGVLRADRMMEINPLLDLGTGAHSKKHCDWIPM